MDVQLTFFGEGPAKVRYFSFVQVQCAGLFIVFMYLSSRAK